MHLSEIRIENFRIFGDADSSLEVPLQPGLNVLVGENDAGKSAVMDAIRLAWIPMPLGGSNKFLAEAPSFSGRA